MHRTLSSTTVSSAQDIRDLRDALAFLSTLPGHLSTTSKAVDAHAELAGIYKRIGAGTPVAPPTRIGPAMLFENVKGYPDVRVLVGMLFRLPTQGQCKLFRFLACKAMVFQPYFCK